VPAVTGLPDAPFLLLAVYVGLTGTALWLTRRDGGSVRDLLSRVLRWRIGLRRWLLILLAQPVLALGIAAATGTLRTPSSGWAMAGLTYLLMVVVVGALLFNVWEEVGWTGFVQDRLMARYGLLRGSLLTAPLFVAIHLPLNFLPGWTWRSAAISIGAQLVAAPFLRYLLGTLWLDTGSLLAVGLLHASFNATGSLGAWVGGWQQIPAMMVLTLLVALVRRLSVRRRSAQPLVERPHETVH
jgi:membrane protease YdiL (CAAX protease family)